MAKLYKILTVRNLASKKKRASINEIGLRILRGILECVPILALYQNEQKKAPLVNRTAVVSWYNLTGDPKMASRN